MGMVFARSRSQYHPHPDPPLEGEGENRSPPFSGRENHAACVAGFFSPEMSFAMHTLARRQGRSLQALMAEAFNDVLRKHGESPLGD